MDCVRAQQLLSEAFDEPTAAEPDLRAAREHCASCAECAAFAHGLTLLARAKSPDPGPELANRIVAAIHAERPAAITPAPAQAPQQRPRERRYWNAIAWAGAAAAVLIVAGFAALAGVRSMLAPTAGSRDAAYTTQESASDSLAATGPATDKSATAAAPESTGEALASPGFISVGGTAYRYVGMAEVEPSTLTTAGSTTTAFDTGSEAQPYTVYATTTPGRVAVLSAEGTRVFEIVTRRVDGATYVLTSGSITSFDEWPTLPASFTQPTTADGAPTFVPAGTDSVGVSLYVRPGTRLEDGFAVAPGTLASDPAMGNPNWTWWVLPQ